ncbi:kanadaptin-like [Stegodyphus dumicola]|uniref:kanadaptin-like n=1 Tax=Stegodyphus dumicola TaxID=202533 RepID=UPI0015AA146C|nr:kanadaptin-like [Stegodyphus dumicola]
MAETDNLSEVFKVPTAHPVQSLSGDNLSSKKNNVNESASSDTDPVSQKTSKESVPLPYNEPEWGGTPPPEYEFEVIKNGTLVSTFKIRTSVVVFGRMDVCDIVFEHPSVSRYHAVLQYCKGDSSHPKGFYLYDLNSTHGTFLNKEQIKPKIYYKLKVGYVLKFGGSSRLHIFQGPEEEEETLNKEESAVTNDDVCDWGLCDDAVEEEEEGMAENPFALSTANEELYLDDPKKTLRGWFEREGYELEYDVEEKGYRTFVCRIQLPVDTPSGDYLPVEASVSGKKKEAVVACALEACRMLDRLGLLRQSHHESRQRKKKKWEENDYYDSDEDTFLDRTGTIEKKREIRKRMDKKQEVETHETIEAKLKAVTEEIAEISNKLSESVVKISTGDNEGDKDLLDIYMSNLSETNQGPKDKIERRKLKFRLVEAEKEKIHLEKLLDITRPAKIPEITNKFPGMIGKKLKTKLNLPTVKQEKIPVFVSKHKNEDMEEVESDMEDVDPKNESEFCEKQNTSLSHSAIEESSKLTNYGLLKPSAKNNEDKRAQRCVVKNVEEDSATNVSNDRQTSETDSERNKSGSNKKCIGPEKPDEIILENQKSGNNSSVNSEKHKRKDNSKKVKLDIDVYATGNSEYSTWVPPSNQSGDGMTHLNAKYGY